MAEFWGWSSCEDAERWTGSASSREEAIEEGRDEFGDEPFWIASGSTPNPSAYIPKSDELIERAAERAYDNVGEIAEEWPDEVSSEARAELDAFLCAWAEKHMPFGGVWIADGVRERIDGAVLLPGEERSKL